jgi:hypothetical protein
LDDQLLAMPAAPVIASSNGEDEVLTLKRRRRFRRGTQDQDDFACLLEWIKNINPTGRDPQLTAASDGYRAPELVLRMAVLSGSSSPRF